MTEDKEMFRLVNNIHWVSTDKDNMEFEASASTYQVDALRQMLSTWPTISEMAWKYASLSK